MLEAPCVEKGVAAVGRPHNTAESSQVTGDRWLPTICGEERKSLKKQVSKGMAGRGWMHSLWFLLFVAHISECTPHGCCCWGLFFISKGKANYVSFGNTLSGSNGNSCFLSYLMLRLCGSPHPPSLSPLSLWVCEKSSPQESFTLHPCRKST